MMVDFVELDRAYPGIMTMFKVQGWISTMSTQYAAMSPYALREAYFHMDWLNKCHIASKVGTFKFLLKTSQIAEFLQVTKDGDVYNIQSEQFNVLVSREELEGLVCQPGVSYKNPMYANYLNPMPYVVWQIMSSIIFPQSRHTTDLLYFAVYTLHGILPRRKINLPLFIINYVFRCIIKRGHAFHMQE